MGNDLDNSKSQIDLSRSICSYEKEGRSLLLPCRECRGSGSLGSNECRAGVLRILTGEKGVDSIILAEYNESMYAQDAVDVLSYLSSIIADLDSFCVEKHETRKLGQLRCGKCLVNPGNLYRSLRKTIFDDVGAFYKKVLESIEREDPESDCTKCREESKDRLLLLLDKAENARKMVLTTGLGVILQEEQNSSRLMVVKHKRPNAEHLLEKARKRDVARLQNALNLAVENKKRIRPCFSNAWIEPGIPKDGTLVRGKNKQGARVRLICMPDTGQSYYHLLPQEYEYERREVKLIQDVREELLVQDLRGVSMEDNSGVREYIEGFAHRSMMRRLNNSGIKRIEASAISKRLSNVLGRYTAGMGVLEYVLQDDNVNDLYVDAPCDQNLVHLTSGVTDDRLAGKMVTNILLDNKEMDTLVSRLRHMSGLPFSEANPVLETDLETYNARATAIGPPLSPAGIAFAFRRHSTEPWTIPRLVKCGSMTPLAGGLLWFLVDGRATMLIAGSRGAGKSSLLGSMLFALPRSQRMLVIEDTPELPVRGLQSLGYKAQGLALGHGMSGRDALRVSLRLGEGALVLGEVRGDEARILYESMRTGTAGSTVLGTFHADSPSAVYERVVHDLGIPFQSFSATDVIAISGLVRPGGGSRVLRRVTHIAEVDKHNEGGFRDLLVYNESTDNLEPTDDFYYRSEVISRIARAWGMTMEEATQNISTRAHVIERMVQEGGEYTSANWTARCFSEMANIMEEGRGENKNIANGKSPRSLESAWDLWFKEKMAYG